MRISVLQVVACLAIALAGLVPVFQRNKPFWGLYGTSFGDGPPRIDQVDDASPAKEAGVRTGDVVLTVNGMPVENSRMNEALESLRPGEEARLRVKREEREIDLTARGVDPPVAIIYYATLWHPVAGGLGLAIGLLVLATQPIRPAPVWRSALVAAVGLGCVVVFFLAVMGDNPFFYWRVRQYHISNRGERLHFHQTWLGLAASLVLALLAALEARSLLARRSVPAEEGRA